MRGIKNNNDRTYRKITLLRIQNINFQSMHGLLHVFSEYIFNLFLSTIHNIGSRGM